MLAGAHPAELFEVRHEHKWKYVSGTGTKATGATAKTKQIFGGGLHVRAVLGHFPQGTKFSETGRVDSLYVNAVSAIGIVSEPGVAVNVDQPDSLKQVAVVCSAD